MDRVVSILFLRFPSWELSDQHEILTHIGQFDEIYHSQEKELLQYEF
jgi:hypothetical protein